MKNQLATAVLGLRCLGNQPPAYLARLVALSFCCNLLMRRLLWILFYRIAAVAPFTGLRRFPEGRGFKQWTGDDSKALMKVHN